VFLTLNRNDTSFRRADGEIEQEGPMQVTMRAGLQGKDCDQN
jgi:hypothetical protein